MQKNDILHKNLKVSEYDRGYPWYEAGVLTEKLDELIRSNAEKEATQGEYAVEGDLLDESQTDGAREGLEPSPTISLPQTGDPP